jgi:hypothetical protein
LASLETTKNLDIVVTKNDVYSNKQRIEIQNSSDTTFLKKRAYDFIDALDQRSKKTSEVSEDTLEFLSYNIILSFLTLVLLLIELWKRRK